MRSPLWFVVAGLVAIAGFVAAGLYLVPRLGSVDAGMIRVVVPGNTTLDLGKAGTYTIFHEKQSVVDGRFYASDSVSGLRVDVIAEATGTPVRLEPATSTSYSMGSRQGTFGAIFALVGGTIAIAFAGLALAGIIVALTLWQRMRAPKPAA